MSETFSLSLFAYYLQNQINNSVKKIVEKYSSMRKIIMRKTIQFCTWGKNRDRREKKLNLKKKPHVLSENLACN